MFCLTPELPGVVEAADLVELSPLPPSRRAFSFFFCFLDNLTSSSGRNCFCISFGIGTAEGIRLSGADGVFITWPFTKVNSTFSLFGACEASSFFTEMVTVGSFVSGLITLLMVTMGWSDLGVEAAVDAEVGLGREAWGIGG